MKLGKRAVKVYLAALLVRKMEDHGNIEECEWKIELEKRCDRGVNLTWRINRYELLDNLSRS